MKKEYAKYLLKKTEEDYDRIAGHFSETRFNAWPEFLYFQKFIKPDDKVLDAGCGNGRISEIVGKSKAEYLGIDLSEEIIRRAKAKYPKEKFQKADILDLKFDEGKFDLIFCNAVLQHIPSQSFRILALENLFYALKQGGYLMMTNWNLWQKNLRYLIFKYFFQKITAGTDLDFRDFFKPWKNAKGEVLAERYLHAFTLSELRGLFELTRFRIIENYYSKNNKKVSFWQGYNLVTIGQKPGF
jgi:2-polyprenyl-3-methyl-5-hydroxy-6-metoxy-1,4-benzoquinol methylase